MVRRSWSNYNVQCGDRELRCCFRVVVDGGQFEDFELALAIGRNHGRHIAYLFAHQRLAYGRGGGDEALAHVRLFAGDQLVLDFLIFRGVVNEDRGAEGGAVAWNVGEIDEGEFRHAFLKLAEARVDEVLALLGHVVLGVLAEVAHSHCLFNFGGQFMGELVFELFDLFQQLGFDVFRHCSQFPLGAVPSRAQATSCAVRNGKNAAHRCEMGSRPSKKEYGFRRLGYRLFLIIRLFVGAVGVEETLQNQHGSDLVDDFPVFGKGASGDVEMTVGFGRGEALVPQVDGEGEGFAERLGEGVGSGGLGADVTGHIDGIAEDDGGAAEFAEEAAERFEVLLRVFANQREDGLSGEAERVGDGDADAAAAEIEAQEAGLHSRDRTSGTERKPHLRMG